MIQLKIIFAVFKSIVTFEMWEASNSLKIMETKRTMLTDISEICKSLDGKVNFTQIQFSQILPCEAGKNVNHLMFIEKKYGVYFYTNSHEISNIMQLKAKTMSIYVMCEGSKTLYEIKSSTLPG